ncbi:MAG TPA: hypothetical protein PK648_06185 [Verrucomicrobiales bacterium]|nr:hypothetical protein [Verrucomicrobiales bacterium]
MIKIPHGNSLTIFATQTPCNRSLRIPPGRECDQDHEHELSHRFTGCQIPLPGRYRARQVVDFLEALPDEVVRAKALVRLSEAPGSRWLFERTGRCPVEKPLQVNDLRRVYRGLHAVLGFRMSCGNH